jgi:hypothetical protein
MGLTLQFLLGNANEIESAVRSVDLELLDDPSVVHQRADFSLHITPKDLDLLSRELRVVSDQSPIDLRPSLNVIFDDKDRGLLIVDESWTRFAASVAPETVKDVAENWARAMQVEYSDTNIKATPEMQQSILDLINLCKAASLSDMQVLHSWFL